MKEFILNILTSVWFYALLSNIIVILISKYIKSTPSKKDDLVFETAIEWIRKLIPQASKAFMNIERLGIISDKAGVKIDKITKGAVEFNNLYSKLEEKRSTEKDYALVRELYDALALALKDNPEVIEQLKDQVENTLKKTVH